MPSKVPSGLGWSWVRRREGGENRRGRREGPSRTRGAGKGAEPAELPGRSPALKSPLPAVLARGDRREAGEMWRGRREGPSMTVGAGEEGFCPIHSSPESLLGSQVGSPTL